MEYHLEWLVCMEPASDTEEFSFSDDTGALYQHTERTNNLSITKQTHVREFGSYGRIIKRVLSRRLLHMKTVIFQEVIELVCRNTSLASYLLVAELTQDSTSPI